MAEFCLKCFADKVLTDKDIHNIKTIHMSETDDLCEGCNRISKYVMSVDSCMDVAIKSSVAKISANDLARYVIWYANKHNVRITLLKLQNLLFFIQIEYAKRNKSLLYNDDVVIGLYGATTKSVYYQFCSYGALPLLSDSEEDGDLSRLSDEDVKLIDKVLEDKIRLSTSKLVQESCLKLYPCLLRRESADKDTIIITADDFLSIANCSI